MHQKLTFKENLENKPLISHTFSNPLFNFFLWNPKILELKHSFSPLAIWNFGEKGRKKSEIWWRRICAMGKMAWIGRIQFRCISFHRVWPVLTGSHRFTCTNDPLYRPNWIPHRFLVGPVQPTGPSRFLKLWSEEWLTWVLLL